LTVIAHNIDLSGQVAERIEAVETHLDENNVVDR
jgi:hypothetical protein